MLIHCPPYLTAKGRNGQITPETAIVWAEHNSTTVHIEIRSRRHGHAAPITLAGPPVELCALLQAMIAAVAEEATRRAVASPPAADAYTTQPLP